MPREGGSSKEEMAQWSAERTIHDAELLQGGAEYEIDETDKPILRPTDNQVEKARKEMERPAQERAEVEKLWAEISAMPDDADSIDAYPKLERAAVLLKNLKAQERAKIAYARLASFDEQTFDLAVADRASKLTLRHNGETWLANLIEAGDPQAIAAAEKKIAAAGATKDVNSRPGGNL